ncbi:DUF262 domain-containing protein [Neotamlana sedimentorum]|uniref:DUF262 domain-containing protein n=1 Tax=Neotamlana sedimentorum TaxID=1435349 RepID=UPI00069C5496|nr:DUF262 domain-containing protein [Tamlana sedimentorum]
MEKKSITSQLSQKEFESIFKNNMKISSYSMSIKTLFSDRMQKKIDYNPYYQRNYVWDRAKATFFIESILLGTDIPPLIFFNSGGKIEVIDGRQRFETMKKFKEGDLALNIKGLLELPQLKNNTFNKLDDDIQGIFEDVKIRIFEFEVINEPKLSEYLEDKIKKEIFRRYNSGITALNTSEIDNAVYDDDKITIEFKKILKENKGLTARITETFLGNKFKDKNIDFSKILQLLRKHFVLTSFPISHYARTNNRQNTLKLLYDVVQENKIVDSSLILDFFENVKLVLTLKDFFQKNELEGNKTLYECILWAICILKIEVVPQLKEFTEEEKKKLLNHYINNKETYNTDFYHYYKEIINRFTDTANIFKSIFSYDFKDYIRDENFNARVKSLKQSENQAKLKLDELSTLRVNKPDPSFIPVEELINDLQTKRYLVRPTYQRQERINEYKASAIIESIILGIYLPPIFIYKNKNGVKEIIDGQQRILSILGFLGKQYLNENNKLVFSKNNNYKLRGLKVIKEINGARYRDLDENEYQEKILDFKLQLIEIDSAINENFQPVDLFIRLNNKPYPIKENSFEMWNSFADKETIKLIREITQKYVSWFYIKSTDKKYFIDRMENAELITILSYINYNNKYRKDYKSVGYYNRKDKITGRIGDKKDVSSIIERLSVNALMKDNFIQCVNEIEIFINLLSKILGEKDLKEKLNSLFNVGKAKRSKIDFYLLYDLLQNIPIDKYKLVDLKDLDKDILLLSSILKNTEQNLINDDYKTNFLSVKEKLVSKYQTLVN